MYKKHILQATNMECNQNQDSCSLWKRIELEYQKYFNDNSTKKKPVDRDLKTIRIFISSTFKDFYGERDVLVKDVFPKLRKWCEEQGLFLVECDLRWGVPADATNLEAVSYCLDEIEKSREETSNHNFFLCLIGDRFGWVPSDEGLINKLKDKYDFIENCSVTLMEIVHGVLRSCTENSLFMIRSADILNHIPPNHLKFYEETEPIMKINVDEQKQFIKKQFNESGCVKDYEISFDSITTDPISGKERLVFSNFESFAEMIFLHLQKQISSFKLDFQLTSAVDDENEDMIHYSILLNMKRESLKRESYVNQLVDQIQLMAKSDDTNNPLIIFTGDAGSGKSTLIGNLIEYFLNKNEMRVFYHFCGASNTSHSQSNIVKRLQRYLNLEVSDEAEEKEVTLNDLFKNENIESTIVFIDAIDELFDVGIGGNFPLSTSKCFLVIISCLNDTNMDSIISKLRSHSEYQAANEIPIERMNRDQLVEITEHYLKNFGKHLDSKQMSNLLAFESSTNPLWLLSACEELRLHGDYSSLTKVILSLPTTVTDLHRAIINRLANQDKSHVLKIFLQLLVISRAGLWESIVRDNIGSILGSSEPISHSIWSDITWQLKGFLYIQTVPLPLIKLRHRVMKESIEAELSMDEELQKSLHLQSSIFYEKVLDSSSDLFLSDYVYHLMKSDSRNKLIDFMRTKRSWAVFKNAFTRSRIMASTRCVNQSITSAKPLMMCTFCANKLGELSIYTINRNSCFYCGGVANLGNNANLHPCTFHNTMNSAMGHCAICSRIAASSGEPVKICMMCKSQGLPGKCGIIVKENDILFRQQLGFSKSVFRIESLI